MRQGCIFAVSRDILETIRYISFILGAKSGQMSGDFGFRQLVVYITIQPIEEIGKIAKESNILFLGVKN